MPTKVIFAAVKMEKTQEAENGEKQYFEFPAGFDWSAAAAAGRVRLDDDMRAKMASMVESLVAETLLWDRSPKAEDVRADLAHVENSLNTLRGRLMNLGPHGLAALEHFLGKLGQGNETTTSTTHTLAAKGDGEGELFRIGCALERLRRALAASLDRLTGIPTGMQNDRRRIMLDLVYRLGPLFEEAGGSASTNPAGPFARFTGILHGTLPDRLRHKSHSDGGIPKAISNAVAEIRKAVDVGRAESWGSYVAKPTQTGQSK